ncbi:hypothetical protein JIG36_37440 [Actinoplanes sp. LDG1-06]|uniref:Uncharacterized protein n=1 Tax=Paractinoplanes ovalisporus TaxID=2810368 RepID=A0ABS2AMX7_9ACTN|nr:hypothetical protein [Actinoplanes ovalisporus]MBM2621202.1 hypothetical protein [Actinoplanes ovalisporus]
MDPEEILENNLLNAFGVGLEGLDAEYVSAADREYEQFTMVVRPEAELKAAKKLLAAYKAKVEREVNEGVSMEMKRHIADTDKAHGQVGEVRDGLLRLVDRLGAGRGSAAEGLVEIDSARAALAYLRGERDRIAINTRVSELKSAHPHRYRDALNRRLPNGYAPSIFHDPKRREELPPVGFRPGTPDLFRKVSDQHSTKEAMRRR